MNQLNFVQVTQEYDQVKKRVNNLKFQLKDIDQKNYLLQAKIKDLRQITPNKTKSPVAQLQEQLRLDRKQVIEQFKPIIEKEGIYLRNERLKTENYLIQSKIWDIQQKKQKVRQIDEYEAQASKRRAQYQEKKIQEVRQRQLQEMETNRINAHKRLREIKNLKEQEQELQDLIQNARTKELQLCNKFCNFICSSETSVVLPSIQKTNSRMSQNSKSQSQSKRFSPFSRNGKYQDKIIKSDIKNDLSMAELNQDKNKPNSRKKSYSIDHLNNMACQTSFMVTETQNQESINYTMNYDSYCSKGKDQTIEKSITNQISSNKIDLIEQDQSQKKIIK